jgi:phage shock protein A
MRQMHDKLVADINSLRARRATILSNLSVAKATERVNKVGAAGSKAEGALQAFSRFEAQAQERLDRARALGSLNEVPKDEAAALADLYKTGGGAALEDELSALKAEMGLAPAVSADDEIAALYAELDSQPIPN